MSFSPNGATLASAGDDGMVRLWSVNKAKPDGSPLHHDGLVNTVLFSPDGATLVTVSDDTVRLWNVVTRRLRGEPIKHTSASAVAFSPDSRTLAIASGDTRLWDVETVQLRGKPFKTGGAALSFSPNGKTLAIATGGSMASGVLTTTWEVPSPVADDPDLMLLSVEVKTGRTIENGLVRRLTLTEWRNKKYQFDGKSRRYPFLEWVPKIFRSYVTTLFNKTSLLSIK